MDLALLESWLGRKEGRMEKDGREEEREEREVGAGP